VARVRRVRYDRRILVGFQESSLFAIIQAAGWPIYLLLAASIIALALIIERLIVLRRDKILPPSLVNEVVELYRARQVTPKVIAKLEANSPLGQVLAAGLRSEQASREVMRESIEESGRAVAHDLERFLNAIGTIASTAPLMGLFGTVWGMIEIFGAQAPAGGTSPEVLAHGISTALYNTFFGLVVAIPSLMFYRYFRRKVDGFVVEMEQQAIRFVDTVHGDRK
jgi:biopolymer transport protein ExbB